MSAVKIAANQLANWCDVRQFRTKCAKWAELGLTVAGSTLVVLRHEGGQGLLGKMAEQERSRSAR